jgi:hypothetical protein
MAFLPQQQLQYIMQDSDVLNEEAWIALSV